VIAQESLEYGWWEAIVIARKDNVFMLRYRDYPHLPKFARHRSAIALIWPSNEGPEGQGRAGLNHGAIIAAKPLPLP
jgi:hypothetical protein